MVIDSYAVYTYLQAGSCAIVQAPLVVQTLLKLHEKKYLHGDAHKDNFLFDGEKILIIDCNPKKAWLGKISYCAEWLYLLESDAGSYQYIPKYITHSFSFRLTKQLKLVLELGKQFKRFVRKKIINLFK